MKFFLILIFLILIINLNKVMAIGFSPGILNYNLDINQEDCKMIKIDSISPTMIIFDKWAENKNIKWNSNLFKKNSDYHNLSVSYPKKISYPEKEINLCISGIYSGKYQGIIIFQEEQQGNSIIQGGVWLNVTIKGRTVQEEEKEQARQISSINENLTQQFIEENKPSITGAIIGTVQRNIWITGIIFILIIVIVYVAILIHNKNKGEFRI